jgi:hypothetical protein
LHVGAALPALGQALGEHPEVDVVVVTHRDALGDAAFQAQLAQARFGRGFLLLVERDGLVQLHRLPWGAPRPLVEVQVDVEKLFARPKGPGPAPLLESGASRDLPGIFRQPVFPLLMPVVGKMEYCATVGEKGGGLCAMTDRRLLHWREHGMGARQLAAELPAGRTCWLGLADKDRAVMVKGRGADGRMSVVIVDSDRPFPKIAAFNGPHAPVAVKLDREVVLIVLHTRVVAVGLENGEVLAETPIPAGHRWIDAGYFKNSDGFCCLAWGGTAAKWVPLDHLRGKAPLDIVTIFDAHFDREIANGWIVTRDGRVLTPLCNEYLQIGRPVDQVRVLDNGRRLLARQSNAGTWRLVDLQTKAVKEVRNDDPAVIGQPVVPPTRNLQANFSAVWAKPGQPLRLMTKRGRWLELILRNGGMLMQEVRNELQKDLIQRGDAQELSFLPTPARLGCRLYAAKWPRGNRAWVDSRGLLHLRAADPEVPEITLTPTLHGAVAGWSADGHRCGPVFFHGGEIKDEPPALYRIVEQFCQHAC